MELSRRLDRVGPFAALAAAVLLTCLGLSSSGIWDPWELDVAERARVGEISDQRPPWLEAGARAAFHAFGPSDWAGRLPNALAAIAVVALAMAIARRVTDPRGVTYAGIVAATTPLLLSNARLVMGDAVAMASQALVGLLAIELTLPEGGSRRRRFAALLALPFALGAAIAVRGALLAVLPPLLGVSLVLLLEGRCRPTRVPRPIFELGLVIASLALTAFVASDVLADRAEYRWALGGVPRGGAPASFDVGLAAIFHALAPWSPVAILGAGRVLARATTTRASDDEPLTIELALVTWAAFAYAAATVFASRYGHAAFLAVAPLAVVVASYARRVEADPRPDRTSLLVVVLLLGLLVRDFALYPKGPIEGLAVGELHVPETFHATRGWALALVGFACAIALALASKPSTEPQPASLRDRANASYARLPAVARRTSLVFGAIATLLAVASLVAIVFGDALPVPTIVVRALRVVLPAELALVVAAFAIPSTLELAGRFADVRFLPAMLAALGVGAYVAFGFLPAVGNDLSPRDAFDTYNALRTPSDRLVVFRLGTRSAPYYAHGPVDSVDAQPALIEHLRGSGRRWAVVPRDAFTTVDRAYREAKGSHLVVADGRSARVLLVTNGAVDGRADANPIAASVSRTPPHPQFPSLGRFGDAIELVGYDLELPHQGYVGAGEKFHVTWHFHALRRPPQGYTIFLHVDGYGLRLNGDHVPVEGLVPLAEWSEGDYIADRQELAVPSNFRPGEYTMFLGFFAGENRLPVTSGQNDGSNRLVAGHVKVK